MRLTRGAAYNEQSTRLLEQHVENLVNLRRKTQLQRNFVGRNCRTEGMLT